MSRPRHLPNVRWFSWLRRGWPSIRGPALEYTIPSTSGNLWTEPQIKSLLNGDVVWQDWFWSPVRINNETVYRQRGGSNWLYKVLFFIRFVEFVLERYCCHDMAWQDEYWYFNANLGARTGQLRARWPDYFSQLRGRWQQWPEYFSHYKAGLIKMRSWLGTQCMPFFDSQCGIYFFATKSAVF